MKASKIIVIVSMAICPFVFSSCYKCSNCTIVDGGVVVAAYDEFCGYSTSVKYFKKDVEYDADNLQCVSCIILAANQRDTLANYQKIYGTEDEIDDFVTDVGRRADIEGGFAVCSARRTDFAKVDCSDR
ncbi:MAG: hypothetical protein KJ607_12770 [Bacteroidetes bacterium]|nr:hypothetical protein [Bacteroidota bacterium]